MVSRIRSIIIISVVSLALAGCGSVAGVTGFGWMTGSHSAVAYNDTAWCVPRKLKKVLNRVAKRYGSVQVHSTKRWWLENWWKGGAKDSYHLNCRAVDFSVRGSPSSVVAFLKAQPEVGGYKHYSSGHYHIDTGPRRTW
ncbi:D-Ala-D-Ala carboxypeptidase family metallohydrolase [Labrenzia sp. CE80]|uniref:YcbK family protein n=1 Tax=Labrenzia sp. CE80 TaxID=1788986 RepID=UPI00129A8C00|nr:D-Ala-D-Ala carboxypeptidase family metallohydrolase [Labrenzia sp. CE80]